MKCTLKSGSVSGNITKTLTIMNASSAKNPNAVHMVAHINEATVNGNDIVAVDLFAITMFC